MRVVAIETMCVNGFKCLLDGSIMEFPSDTGLYFMTGANHVDPSLGANGAGKSSIWDALCWCLFGTSVRGERASEVQRWGDKTPPHVIVVLSVDEEQHIIERIGSPNRLVHNSSNVDQEAIDRLLGMSKARFLQSIVYGQNSTLFMDLPAPERGALMDEVMEFGKWSELSKLAGAKANSTRKAITEFDRSLAFQQGQLESDTIRLQELHAAHQQWLRDKASQVADIQSKRQEYYLVVQQFESQLDQISREPPTNTNEWEDYLRSVDSHRVQQRAIISRCEHSLGFFGVEPVCPQCQQGIPHEYSERIIASVRADLAQAQQSLTALDTAYTDTRNTIDQLRAATADRASRMSEAQAMLAHAQTECRHFDLQLQSLQQNSPHAEQIRIVQTRVNEMRADIETGVQHLEQARVELAQYEYWEQAFKRVRLFLIRRTLTLIEVETANAASLLGVGHWRIEFNTEVENKSGTVRPGVYIEATNAQGFGTYKSFSGGESQRVKLAVSIGLATHIQSMAGVYYSMEVWDEPTAWLSNEGIDDLIECLRQRSVSTGKALWLVDHRSLHYAFDGVWKVTKESTGSIIEVR